MKAVASRPQVHLFVCANVRDSGDPLGEGCGAGGEAIYARLKTEVRARGLVGTTWVTRTACLGFCPPRGATVARYPKGEFFVEVAEDDAATLLNEDGR